MLTINPAHVLDVGGFAGLAATARNLYSDTVLIHGVGPETPEDLEPYDAFHECHVLEWEPPRRYDLAIFPVPRAVYGEIEEMVKLIRKNSWRMLVFSSPGDWEPTELRSIIGSSLAVKQNLDGYRVTLL